MNAIIRHIEEAAGADIMYDAKSGNKHHDIVANRYTLILVAQSYGVPTRLITKWLGCSVSTINYARSAYNHGFLPKAIEVSVTDLQRKINGKLTDKY